jgi:glycosyltransferase involved in cell wall biosynthesis
MWGREKPAITSKISVIIPTYNSATYLPYAIDSVLSQTAGPLEVIVVDDGSTDNTARVLEPSRPRISYLFQENRGPVAARNGRIAATEGDLIAFLDADNIWLPEKLQQQQACLPANPHAALLHSDMLLWLRHVGPLIAKSA